MFLEKSPLLVHCLHNTLSMRARSAASLSELYMTNIIQHLTTRGGSENLSEHRMAYVSSLGGQAASFLYYDSFTLCYDV